MPSREGTKSEKAQKGCNATLSTSEKDKIKKKVFVSPVFTI